MRSRLTPGQARSRSAGVKSPRKDSQAASTSADFLSFGNQAASGLQEDERLRISIAALSRWRGARAQGFGRIEEEFIGRVGRRQGRQMCPVPSNSLGRISGLSRLVPTRLRGRFSGVGSGFHGVAAVGTAMHTPADEVIGSRRFRPTA